MTNKAKQSILGGGEVIYKGWAWKVGGKVKTWKRRFFTLKGNVLTYGKDKLTVLKEIDLRSITKLEKKELKTPKKQYDAFGLVLYLANREFKMVPESEEEQRAWAQYLTPFELFNEKLETIMMKPNHEDVHIPVVVDQCITELCKGKMDTRGLFRISGSARRLNILTKQYNTTHFYRENNEWNTNPVEGENTHVIASLLKQFFRRGPSPVIHYELYDEIINLFKSYSIDEYQDLLIEKLNELLKSLSHVHANCLNVVCYCLYEVDQQNELMKASNLGVVWGPVLLRQKRMNMSHVMLMTQAVHFMIANYKKLFKYDAPYLEKYQTLVSHYSDIIKKKKEAKKIKLTQMMEESQDIDIMLDEITQIYQEGHMSENLYSRLYHALFYHPEEATERTSYKALFAKQEAKSYGIKLAKNDEAFDLAPTFSTDDLTEYTDTEVDTDTNVDTDMNVDTETDMNIDADTEVEPTSESQKELEPTLSEEATETNTQAEEEKGEVFEENQNQDFESEEDYYDEEDNEIVDDE